MPRRLRVSTGGFAYHVLNRAVARQRLFDDDADYLALERVIEQTQQRLPMRIASYCLMPNHWHLVLWPREDGELSEFMRLLTVTHTQRWHAHRHSANQRGREYLIYVIRCGRLLPCQGDCGVSTGGFAYHVLNRAVARQRLFDDDADYLALERVIEQTQQRLPMRIASYCLMPNHWHLVLWPREDGELSEFMRLLTVTHTQRWHAHRHSAGSGPVYQGRFKSFPIQRDEHFLTVCRYVERNALRANLVNSAPAWRWCSLAKRLEAAPPKWLLRPEEWPVPPPADWIARVNRAQTVKELEKLRVSVRRGRPFGEDRWQRRTAAKLGLQSTLRPRGRQRTRPIKDSRPL